MRGPDGLELGPAEGEMTQFLVQEFVRLTVVDGSVQLLTRIPDTANLLKVHSLFEEFEPRQRFSTIILEHILEHVEHPVELLKRVKSWSTGDDGRILLGVPNGHSVHRLAAVKMGLLASPTELNQRDHTLGHRRVYTSETFRRDIETAGLRVLETGGVFFKPLSNLQIQEHWTEEMMDGFFELGKDFPEHGAELYAVCQG
jgi:2-polyprenyl-3-methyl-5-hydroxy-6-metoxy-1,4-benzoquinol methylase